MVLPLTGLEIELPKTTDPGHTWLRSSKYVIHENGEYEGVDNLVERSGDDVVAVTSVQVGRFGGADCDDIVGLNQTDDDVLAGAPIPWIDRVDDRWLAATLVDSERSKDAPTSYVLMCADAPRTKPSTPPESPLRVLIHQEQFGNVGGKNTSAKQLMAVAQKSKLLHNIRASWNDRHFATGASLKGGVLQNGKLNSVELKNVGQVDPVREVYLRTGGFGVQLPDDGFVWTYAAGGDADHFDRVVPMLPALRLHLTLTPKATCNDAFTSVGVAAASPAAIHLAPDWAAGPVVGSGREAQHLVCYDSPRGAVVVRASLGNENNETKPDFLPLAPLLGAIAAAVR